MTKTRILVVDAQGMRRERLKESLERAGFEVMAKEKAGDLLPVHVNEGFDLVIVGHNSPNVALDMLAEARGWLRANVPAILTVAAPHMMDAERRDATLDLTVMALPVRTGDLLEKIREMLAAEDAEAA